LLERQGGSNEMVMTFPANFTVHKNDYIVVHENANDTTHCNPNSATSETTTKTDQPAATYAGNYDTAFDFWNADTGLVATNNTLTLYDPTNTIVDAVFIGDGASATSGSTLTQAGIIGTANQWQPAATTYDATAFYAAAVQNSNMTGMTAAGNSLQRTGDTDTDAKADWTTGTGAASTWGANNAGQANIP